MNPKQLMLRDGAPAALFMTAAQRAKAWAGRPLTTIPLFIAAPRDESDETKAFRAQEEERRRLKSLHQIDRMKARMATKKIDFSKVRWDARTAKFVPLEGDMPKPLTEAQSYIMKMHQPEQPRLKLEKRHPNLPSTHPANRGKTIDPIWSRVNKDTAAPLARLNGVWDDKYAKLSGGLLVMTVTNRLKGLVKKGGEVRWQ